MHIVMNNRCYLHKLTKNMIIGLVVRLFFPLCTYRPEKIDTRKKMWSLNDNNGIRTASFILSFVIKEQC